MTPAPTPISAEPPNTQTAEVFAAERAIIEGAAVALTWVRPSDHDPDRLRAIESITLDADGAPEADLLVDAGRVRGLLLHKLMEEVLTGELVERWSAFPTAPASWSLNWSSIPTTASGFRKPTRSRLPLGARCSCRISRRFASV
jgi:hypothetical protein